MAKIVLSDVTSGYSAAERINANSDKIEAALENTLSRDGTAPNQMGAHLDMNGKRILNIASPQSPTDPARLADITDMITLTGTEVPALVGNNGLVLQTDGSFLYFGPVPYTALPIFTGASPGAVDAPGSEDGSKLLSNAGWEDKEDIGFAWVAERNAFSAGNADVPVALGNSASGTVTVNTLLGNVFTSTLTGNPTFTFSNPVSGSWVELRLTQDATGSRTVTWPTVTWQGGAAPQLSALAGSIDVVHLRYVGTTWYGRAEIDTPPNTLEDEGDYDYVFRYNESNVDLFYRLGAPSVARVWNVLIKPGVVLTSAIHGEPALDFGGGFPSTTVINVVSQGGYIVGLGGDGDGGQVSLDDSSSITLQHGIQSSYKDGTAAIRGPISGVTVNYANAQGYVWGGGGGGGAGGAAANGTNLNASSGAGGGGAGRGKGGLGLAGQTTAATGVANGTGGGDGKIYLSGADSSGPGGVADVLSTGSAGNGGNGGDFGEAGDAGTAASGGDSAGKLPATTGGAAGRAVLLQVGTFNFTSGSSTPHVKGAVS